MTADAELTLASTLERGKAEIFQEWVQHLEGTNLVRDGRIKDAELRKQCQDFLTALVDALKEANGTDIDAEPFNQVRALLDAMSKSRALQGFSPRDTALFVFSLKQPMFKRLRVKAETGKGADDLTWVANTLIDDLGLYTTEMFQKSREEVINRQNLEIAELATPVVSLWDGIIGLPLIGTLDSARTQTVMENLLNAIVEHEAEIAIIDITGVPTVDTLVAQHLLKTVSAARLMGADCVISGIRPQIAQTMVHLGVDLNVTTKPTLEAALKHALRQTNWSFARGKPAPAIGGLS